MQKAAVKPHPQTLTKPNGETFTFNMVEVEGGTFTMGLNGKLDMEKPAHEVKLNSFLAAEYPVTQCLYEFVTGKNPSYFLGRRRPVERVSWYDAVEFCNRLSELAGLEAYYIINKDKKDQNNTNGKDDPKWLVEMNPSALGYRLPTEAEWEYAARGGVRWEDGFEYAGSNDLRKVGWYGENGHKESQPVGLKTPNQLGLYDISGNIYEWCWDWYDGDFYGSSPSKNPLGAEQGHSRVLRCGSWGNFRRSCRVADRSYYFPYLRNNYFGFRVFSCLGL